MSSKKNGNSAVQLTKYQSIEDNILGETQIGTAEDYNDQSSLCDDRLPFYLIGTFATAFVALLIWTLSRQNVYIDHDDANAPMFDSLGRYIMYNFDDAKPMTSFLPALGGVWGYPMWAFYTNRGQGMTAFGINNKDGAIAKFNTAEKAFQQTPFTGFRTFVKGTSGAASFESMPFGPQFTDMSVGTKPSRKMSIGMNEMEISEVDPVTKLKTTVLYFTVPEEEFACMVRKVTFTNLGAKDMELEVIDGLAKLEPSGIPNFNLDSMGRTMEAWKNVYNVGHEGNDNTQPFFHASQGTADTAAVQVIKDGHFSLAFVEDDSEVLLPDGGSNKDPDDDDDEDEDDDKASRKKRHAKGNVLKVEQGPNTRLPFIVDPNIVFGTDTVLAYPSRFFGAKGLSVEALLAEEQGTSSRTPCAYSGHRFTLRKGKNISIVSMYGHAATLDVFTEQYSPKLLTKGYVAKKRAVASALVKDITARVATKTSSALFDSYIQQNFLDNVLRGGLPLQLGGDDATDVDKCAVQQSNSLPRPKIYHVYSRIHGDLERDYNSFNIDTTFFSQGPGNFRDVSQNRRSDVVHTPRVGDFDVRMFLSLVQADGYNPLTVASTLFRVPKNEVDQLVGLLKISKLHGQKKDASDLLSESFRPGKLLKDLEAAGVFLGVDRDTAVNLILASSQQVSAAKYAQNGYWADHWTYTLDLVESFVSIFPDMEEEMLWDSAKLPFFLSPSVVKPRSSKYVLVDDPDKVGEKTLRIYNAVSQWGDADFPNKRLKAITKIQKDKLFVSSADGSGAVWQQDSRGNTFGVSPITKLSMLGLIKFATMDPQGMGVEMEGGKPGWNDAMNGLPGIMGSGMSETYELLLIVRYVRKVVLQYARSVSFPEEFSDLLDGLSSALDELAATRRGLEDEFVYWDTTNDLRETYREQTMGVFDGTMIEWSAKHFVDFLDKVEAKTVAGIKRALETNGGLSPTFFYYECVDYSVSKSTGVVTPKKFELRTLPLFLEGPVRYLKTVDSVELKRQVYETTKESDIYDKDLQMFKISGSLKSMNQQIGRMMAFSPGWLENESVWLHMSYKFYLELLRGKLYDAFYLEIRTGLVPFMDPSVYGRSPLEAASFIVSSAFPDKNLHGASFLARLSGSTAEFLSMWVLITQGANPFRVNDEGALTLALEPALAGWLFPQDGVVSFMFLGETLVSYHNPLLHDTWNTRVVRYEVEKVDGSREVVEGWVIGPELARATRNLQVKSIDAFFG